MSAFIGPIHYWLYGKIRLVTNREEFLYHKASELCGSTAEELREQVIQSFGLPLPDTDLGELIDHDNIHGWLQRQIKIVESREAAFIKELLDSCGTTALEVLDQSFYEHGKITGESAKERNKYDLETAPGIYKALNDFYLNGMPCDQGDMIMESDLAKVVWESSQWLQEPNWKRAGTDINTMAKLYLSWLKGFVNGANTGFTFAQTSSRADGEATNRFQIHKQ